MSEERPRDEEADQHPMAALQSPEEIDLGEREYNIYECQTCDNIVLTMQESAGGMKCHGESMQPIEDWQMDVRTPDLRQVLLDAFGLPKAGLDICLCVIGEGPVSPAEVAEELDYDASTVREYLNQLVTLGLLQKSQLNREEGGFVNVYHSVDLDEMRRETLVGFYVWAGEAASLIERANLTKQDYEDAETAEGLHDVFWESFETDDD